MCTDLFAYYVSCYIAQAVFKMVTVPPQCTTTSGRELFVWCCGLIAWNMLCVVCEVDTYIYIYDTYIYIKTHKAGAVIWGPLSMIVEKCDYFLLHKESLLSCSFENKWSIPKITISIWMMTSHESLFPWMKNKRENLHRMLHTE